MDAVFWLVAQTLLLMHFTSVSLEGSGWVPVFFSLLSLTSVLSSVIQTVFTLSSAVLHFLYFLVKFPALTFIFYSLFLFSSSINFSYTCLGFFYEMLKKGSGKRVCWSEMISGCICWPTAIFLAIYCYIVLYFLISLLKQVNPEPRNPLWDDSCQSPHSRLSGGFKYISAAVKELIQHFILRESAAKKRRKTNSSDPSRDDESLRWSDAFLTPLLPRRQGVKCCVFLQYELFCRASVCVWSSRARKQKKNLHTHM